MRSGSTPSPNHPARACARPSHRQAIPSRETRQCSYADIIRKTRSRSRADTSNGERALYFRHAHVDVARGVVCVCGRSAGRVGRRPALDGAVRLEQRGRAADARGDLPDCAGAGRQRRRRMRRVFFRRGTGRQRGREYRAVEGTVPGSGWQGAAGKSVHPQDGRADRHDDRNRGRLFRTGRADGVHHAASPATACLARSSRVRAATCS